MTVLELILRTAPLGLGAALTPSLLGLQILTISSNPWRARALAVIAGASSAFAIACMALLFGFAQLPNRVHPGGLGDALVWLAAGVVLALASVWLFKPHPALERRVERSITEHVAHARVRVFFTLAFALSIKDVSSFVLLVPATHDIATSAVDFVGKVIALLIVFALAMSPVLVPPLVRLFTGDHSNGAMAKVYRFTMDHQMKIGGTVAAVFACYLIAVGVETLLR